MTGVASTKDAIAGFVARFRQRLGDDRFWVTQALVIAISIAHTSLEATHALGVLPDLYLVPVSTYFIPTVYAGLNFGLEGAIPTALWCCVLASPNVVFFHHGWERAGVAVQLSLMVAVAFVIARRVEQETSAKQRAEAASARLVQLNATAVASTRSLVLKETLRNILGAMLEGGKMTGAWAVLAPAGWSGKRTAVALAGSPPASTALGTSWENAARIAVLEARPVRASDGHLATAPVLSADGAVGALGIEADAPISSDDEVLLEAIARQLGVALANIQHYEEVKRMVAELERAQSTLQEYLHLATTAQEEERRRLARELHDSTIQTLVIVKSDLDAAAAADRDGRDRRYRGDTALQSRPPTVDPRRPRARGSCGLADRRSRVTHWTQRPARAVRPAAPAAARLGAGRLPHPAGGAAERRETLRCHARERPAGLHARRARALGR